MGIELVKSFVHVVALLRADGAKYVSDSEGKDLAAYERTLDILANGSASVTDTSATSRLKQDNSIPSASLSEALRDSVSGLQSALSLLTFLQSGLTEADKVALKASHAKLVLRGGKTPKEGDNHQTAGEALPPPTYPYHETSFYRHFEPLPKCPTMSEMEAALPEIEEYHAFWLLPDRPTIAIPVRRMWHEMRNFEFEKEWKENRDKRYKRQDDGSWAVNLDDGDTWSQRHSYHFEGDSVPRRAMWFYTTNAVFQQLNEFILRDDIPERYHPLIVAMLHYFQEEPVRQDWLTARGARTMTPTDYDRYIVNESQRLSKFVSTSYEEPFSAAYKLHFEIPWCCTATLLDHNISEYTKEKEVLLAPCSVVRCVGKQEVLDENGVRIGGRIFFRVTPLVHE